VQDREVTRPLLVDLVGRASEQFAPVPEQQVLPGHWRVEDQASTGVSSPAARTESRRTAATSRTS